MNKPESNFASWLHKADHDLLNINNNLAAGQIPWDTICFHEQQIDEKVLKGFLVYHGRDLVKTHDLVALLAQCVTLDPQMATLESDCRALTSFGVAARYPDDLFEPTEIDGREMVEAAQRVRIAILAKLPQST